MGVGVGVGVGVGLGSLAWSSPSATHGTMSTVNRGNPSASRASSLSQSARALQSRAHSSRAGICAQRLFPLPVGCRESTSRPVAIASRVAACPGRNSPCGESAFHVAGTRDSPSASAGSARCALSSELKSGGERRASSAMWPGQHRGLVVCSAHGLDYVRLVAEGRRGGHLAPWDCPCVPQSGRSSQRCSNAPTVRQLGE